MQRARWTLWLLLAGCGELRQRERPSDAAAADGGSDAPAPRPLGPMSGAVVPSARPELRWRLPAGVPTALVELSTERTFPPGMVVSQEVTGERWTVPMPLDGRPRFWRLRGRSAAGIGREVSPVWNFRSEGRPMVDARIAWWSAWDHDGDGHPDLAVGDPSWVQGGVQGAVSVFVNPRPEAFRVPGPTLTQGVGRFGAAVSSAGDLDGDGFSELAVGAPEAPGGGAVYIYWGASDLRTATPTALRPGPGTVSFGTSVAALGDTDGDGYSDLAVGAPEQGPTGAVYIVRGGPERGSLGRAIATLPAPPDARTFGFALAGLGDINLDGSGEVLVGAPALNGGQPSAAVFELGRMGMAGPPGMPPRFELPGIESFGFAVAHLGDVDGDGFGDIGIGAPGANGHAGGVYFYNGSMGRFPMTPSRQYLGTPGARLGYALAGVGDCNGDVLDDVAFGAPTADSTRTDGLGPGRAFLLLGGPGFFTAEGSPRDAYTPGLPGMSMASLGLAVRGLGDSNGDRAADLVVGVPGNAQVLLILGGPTVMEVFRRASFHSSLPPPMAMARAWGSSLAALQ